MAGNALVLDRGVSFRFALNLNQGQERLFWQLAGTRRFVYNRLLDAVHARMDARVWEAELGAEPWTPWGWGKLDLIRHVKGLRAAHPWLGQLPWDVAECAAVDLATALKNYSESRRGYRRRKRVGFPKRKSRKAPRQSFRLRHPGQVHVDATTVTLPGLARTPRGRVNVCGPTRRLRRLLAAGRFRPVSVTVSFEHHHWWAASPGWRLRSTRPGGPMLAGTRRLYEYAGRQSLRCPSVSTLGSAPWPPPQTPRASRSRCGRG